MNLSRESVRPESVVSVILVLMLGALFLPGPTWANSTGPDDHLCDDPPNVGNCTACHNSFPLNSPGGSLQLLGLPADYTPGANYTLTIALERVGQQRWGFEITVIKPDGMRGGQLAVTDPNIMQLSANSTYNRDYLKHTSTGTFPGTPTGHQWDISWTAPASGTGPVTFYLAGNAANNAQGNQGDYIYTMSAALPEEPNAVLGPVYRQPETPEILTAYPNPFNPQVTLNLASLPGDVVKIELMDSFGRLLSDYTMNSAEGISRLPLNLEYLPSGRYFARAITRQGHAVITLVKVK